MQFVQNLSCLYINWHVAVSLPSRPQWHKFWVHSDNSPLCTVSQMHVGHWHANFYIMAVQKQTEVALFMMLLLFWQHAPITIMAPINILFLVSIMQFFVTILASMGKPAANADDNNHLKCTTMDLRFQAKKWCSSINECQELMFHHQQCWINTHPASKRLLRRHIFLTSTIQ